MKNILLPVVMTLFFVNDIFGQKSFHEKYDTFRYSLYDQLGEGEPFDLSNETGAKIARFLEQNEKDIRSFREGQLKRYRRPGLEENDSYIALEAAKFNEIREQVVLLNSKGVMAQAELEYEDSEKYPNVEALMNLLAVDPIQMIFSASTQIMSLVLIDDLEISEITKIYGKMGIAGVYIATEQLNKEVWKLTLDSYYLISQFTINVNSGSVELTSIKKRN